jgi:hypothetical protein
MNSAGVVPRRLGPVVLTAIESPMASGSLSRDTGFAIEDVSPLLIALNFRRRTGVLRHAVLGRCLCALLASFVPEQLSHFLPAE